MKRASGTFAFTLIELLVVIAIIALLVSILVPALGRARKMAKLVQCESNLKQLGVSMNTYANDFKDQLFTFSWKKGQSLSSDPSLNNAGSDMDAACNQMVDIVRRLGGRTPAETPTLTLGTFQPYMRFSHLVLQDYLGKRIPDPIVACPEDRDQLKWGLDPRGYDQGLYTPNYGTGGQNWYWPYRSNYWFTLSAFDKNASPSRAVPVDYTHLITTKGLTKNYGNRMLSEISFPSSKVFMFEQYGRHTSSVFDYRTHYGFNTSRCVVQMFDNSVALRNSKDANRGNADPNDPTSLLTQTPYNAEGTTPDPAAPNGSIPSYVRFFCTRGGLKGIDFGGKEVSTTKY